MRASRRSTSASFARVLRHSNSSAVDSSSANTCPLRTRCPGRTNSRASRAASGACTSCSTAGSTTAGRLADRQIGANSSAITTSPPTNSRFGLPSRMMSSRSCHQPFNTRHTGNTTNHISSTAARKMPSTFGKA